MKYFSYLNTSVEITGLYKGQQPFHLFIKDFFRQHKKYGSTDRKQITHLCYCYYRLGPSMLNMPATDKTLAGLFLCTHQPNEILAAIRPAWNEQVSLSLEEKCALINIPFQPLSLFPCTDELSNAIDTNNFILSHLTQPDIFLRTRPGYHQTVTDKLTGAGIVFSQPAPHCTSLPNTTKIDGLLQINKEVVIQDYSSQQTGAFLQLVKYHEQPVKTWDCCAASGGKSIMAKDVLGSIDLTVSDIRKLVLINLKKRFAEAGMPPYKTLMADLSKPVTTLSPASFQLIIADLPCTGSGTWGRTPERLSFFDKKEIDSYSLLQKKIVKTVMPYLQKDGYFLYITCSVFKKENEEMVAFIQKNFSADLLKMEVLKGYGIKADTMFAALLKKL